MNLNIQTAVKFLYCQSTLCTLFAMSLSIDEYHAKKKLMDSAPPVDFTKATAIPSDVQFYLYTNYLSNSVHVNLNGKNSKTQLLNTTLPTKLFFHGYTTDTTSPWYPLLKDEYFRRGLHNIIYVDWSKAGNLTYGQSSANVDPVGEFTADMLIAAEVPLENVHLIGHSLGSQVVGFAGKHAFRKTGRKIGRITGLDPARPSFESLPQDKRLCPEDGTFVDVIHTDIDYFGFAQPMGHVDFYPNEGLNQPGCGSHLVDENCSHARSTLFFMESIRNRNATAVKAEFKGYSQVKPLTGNKDSVVFGDGCPGTARGVYYLETNSKSPYLRCSNNKDDANTNRQLR